MPQKYFSILNLIYVQNGFILLYQDMRNNLKGDLAYYIISDRRKALIEIFFSNFQFVHSNCDKVGFHHPIHFHFSSFSNQNHQIFGIYHI